MRVTTVRKPVVLIDMDGTIADFDARVYALMVARHPEVKLPPFEQRAYPLSGSLPSGQRPLLAALFAEVGFYREMVPVEGAVEALHQMVAAGIEVRLCSSPLGTSPICASEKIEWVIAHLGQSWYNRLILTRDKTLIRGDFLIDDAPQAKGDCLEAEWEHVYFDQPYNRPGAGASDGVCPARRRLVAWKDWRSCIPLVIQPTD